MAQQIYVRLAELRLKHGRISVRELASKTGLGYQTLLKLDEGHPTTLMADMVAGICDYFGIGIAELLVLEPKAEDQNFREGVTAPAA